MRYEGEAKISVCAFMRLAHVFKYEKPCLHVSIILDYIHATAHLITILLVHVHHHGMFILLNCFVRFAFFMLTQYTQISFLLIRMLAHLIIILSLFH